MNRYQLEACAPHFRDAFKAIVDPEIQYYRQTDLELAESADKEPWMPSQFILGYQPGLCSMPVCMLDDTIDHDALLSDFARLGHVGLVLMGQNVTRRKRPAVIVLSTYEAFYVIDPDYKKGIQFLDTCLRDDRLSFWTTNGFHESNCLLEQFNISLLGTRAKDCLGLHLTMMKVIDTLKNTLYQKKYPARAIAQACRPLRLEPFDRLIYIWLDVPPGDSVFCPPNQLAHLSQRPLNLTAVNLIKKRCCLVLLLAESLMSFAKLESREMNYNIIKSLTSMKSDTIRKMRQYIKNCEKKKRLVKTYFAHLDGDTGSVVSDDDSGVQCPPSASSE